MRASVDIGKSFDEGKSFSKEYANGDLAEFFVEEGKYLDRLADILRVRGKAGDEFTVTYTVKLKK